MTDRPNPLRPWSTTFGDDPDPELVHELPHHAAPNSSAARFAASRRARDAEAARDRADLADAIAADVQRDDQHPLRGIPSAQVMARAALRRTGALAGHPTVPADELEPGIERFRAQRRERERQRRRSP